MPRLKLKLLIVLISISLSGCAGFGITDDLPTLMPDAYVPTAIALTAQALISPTYTPDIASSLTPEPTEVFVAEVATTTPESPPNENAVLTPTSSAGVVIPGGEIQIANPGPLSKIVSPLSIIAYVTPGGDGNAQVELWGEDERLMYRRVFNFLTPNPQGRLVIKFGFETEGVAEVAHLVISTRDIHGRIQALTSQDLILLAEGDMDINIPGDLLAPIVIQQPQEMVLIQGGELTVSGLVRTTSNQPLLVELIAADGSVVGSRLAGAVLSERGEHHAFSTDIPYQVDAPTWVRVTVTERGGRFPGPINIATLEVLLSP